MCDHCQNTGKRSLLGRHASGLTTFDRSVCPDESCPHRERYLRQLAYLKTAGLVCPASGPAEKCDNRKVS